MKMELPIAFPQLHHRIILQAMVIFKISNIFEINNGLKGNNNAPPLFMDGKVPGITYVQDDVLRHSLQEKVINRIFKKTTNFRSEYSVVTDRKVSPEVNRYRWKNNMEIITSDFWRRNPIWSHGKLTELGNLDLDIFNFWISNFTDIWS